MSGRKAKILVLFIFMIFSAGSSTVAAVEERLSSPLTARTFYNIGRELYADQQADFLLAKQAVIFLNAAVNLDNRANYILPEIINIAWQYPDENISDAVRLALIGYVDRSSDLEVTSKAVGYLLERLDTREKREELLLKLLGQFQQKNVMFASDLSAQLGFLKAETADLLEAQKYLMQAFSGNKYNRLAFAKLAELSETGDRRLSDIAYLYNLRFAVRANPLDFTSVYSFAQYAETLGLYEPAAEAYQYCIDLVKYLQGQKALGPDLYRPLMLNCYNAQQYSRCQQIARQLRDMDVFDVRVEAIASAAALQNDDENSFKTILDRIKSRADKILTGRQKASSSELEDYAWFFNFIADVNSQEDLTWATKAYDAEPNSINAASLFAYALVKNNQIEVAESLLKKIGTTMQAAGLAQGIILVQKGDVNSGRELLKKVVGTLPGTFESQKAKEKPRRWYLWNLI